MWPMRGVYSVTAPRGIFSVTGPPLPKLKVLAWRFFFWIIPRWLSQKFQVFMMRRIFRRNPAEVERQIRVRIV